MREFVRAVQNARKEAKLTPRDKVKVFYGANVEEAILSKYNAEILSATNSTELVKGEADIVTVEKM